MCPACPQKTWAAPRHHQVATSHPLYILGLFLMKSQCQQCHNHEQQSKNVAQAVMGYSDGASTFAAHGARIVVTTTNCTLTLNPNHPVWNRAMQKPHIPSGNAQRPPHPSPGRPTALLQLTPRTDTGSCAKMNGTPRSTARSQKALCLHAKLQV